MNKDSVTIKIATGTALAIDAPIPPDLLADLRAALPDAALIDLLHRRGKRATRREIAALLQIDTSADDFAWNSIDAIVIDNFVPFDHEWHDLTLQCSDYPSEYSWKIVRSRKERSPE